MSRTAMCFTPALRPRCTTHHAVLSARHPSIHRPCQYPLPVISSPPISWPHQLSIIFLFLHIEAHLFFPFHTFFYFSSKHSYNCTYPQPPALLTPSSFSLSSFFHFISSHVFAGQSPTQPPFSLPVCSDRFCGRRTSCVNVKPFPAMIMFITHCVPRCSWININ